jgi:hypothetical protein
LSQRIGLTRGKAALIGVLAAALVGVVYVQYGPSEDDDAPPADVAYSPPPPHAPQAPHVSTPITQPSNESPLATDRTVLAAAFDQTRWKPPELAQVVAYDPFALPNAFPQPAQAFREASGAADGSLDVADAASDADRLAEAIAQFQTELESLQQRGVQVIVRQRDQYVAMIGDRTVHVGDEINGFTVTAIDPDGVRVERKISQ